MSHSTENNSVSVKNTQKKQSKEMEQQSKVLWTINQITRNLLTVRADGDFDALVRNCLYLLSKSIKKRRIYIWQDQIDDSGNISCVRTYEWCHGELPVQKNLPAERVSYDRLPSLQMKGGANRCLNSLAGDFSEDEIKILSPHHATTIMLAPIAINGKRWGFIGVDNYENDPQFTNIEENMLQMSGSMLASSIEKMKTESELREMEEHTQLMLNATPLCCNLWTSDFYNMRCNDEAVRLFELSSQKEYLERFEELSPKYQPNGKLSCELSAEYISKAFKEGYHRFEWLHQKLDGTPVPAEITLVRIKYKDDFIVAGYTRDLREEKAMLAELKTKEALRLARDEALLNSKAKSNFLANMSHEIRTPMNTISGFSEIILRESTNEKTAKYAKGIKDACNNLINIVNDILDISKIESGKMKIYNSTYELASLLNDVITISNMRLRNKPLMFITDIDSRLPARLEGDEMRIKQILLNILSNAIKYTNEGYIALRVSGTVDGTKATLHVSVTDSGIGIKPKDLERLFEEFERINTTKNRDVEGTGLGLAISKQLCEMMGGTIKVESTYGEGSRFTVVLAQECPSYERLAQVTKRKSVLLYEPREHYRLSITKNLENLDCICVSCANQVELYNNIGMIPYDYILTPKLYLKKIQDIVKRYSIPASVATFVNYGGIVNDSQIHTIVIPVNCLQLAVLLNGQQMENPTFRQDPVSINFTAPSARVLVVDDNPVNLQVAQGLMEPYEFVIDTANNGAEAVHMVKHTKYDLVFMDHMMPEMDGIDATAAIRRLEGEYFKELPIIALTANAIVGTREMFIREGMNDFISKPIKINKLALVLLKWLPQSKIKSPHLKESTDTSEETPSWNIRGVDIQKGIFALGGSRENYLKILSAYYKDGRQKCSLLRQYVEENSIPAFRIEIHAIKSTSTSIGATQISSMAEKLEMAAQNNDIPFIHKNMEEFLSCFQQMLNDIEPIVSNQKEHAVPQKDDTNTSDISYLINTLDTLIGSLEFANISLIEENLKLLNKFSWAEKISEELETVKKHLSVFDYDSALECVNRLKNSL